MTFSSVDKAVKAGDKIRITAAYSTEGKYENGDILTVRDVLPGRRVYVEEHSRVIAFSEFEVLETRFKKGDKVRVVDARATRGDYKNGDVLTVKSVDVYPSLGITSIKVEEHERTIFEEELEPYAEEEPKVGDLVEVVKAIMPAGRYEEGDVLTVKNVADGGLSGRRMIEVEEHDQPLYSEEVKVVGRMTPVGATTSATRDEKVEALAERVDAVEATVSHLDALISQKADKHEHKAERDIQAEIDSIEKYLVKKYPDAEVTVSVSVEFEGVGSRDSL